MLRGILISLFSLAFIWLYVLFFHATETAQWHGYFRLSNAVYIPFVALSVIMFKQKQALAEHLKRIKNNRSLPFPILFVAH